MSDVNVCCPYFAVLPCYDTSEHAHITCDTKEILTGTPVLDNQFAKDYCLDSGAEFGRCPHYPRRG